MKMTKNMGRKWEWGGATFLVYKRENFHQRYLYHPRDTKREIFLLHSKSYFAEGSSTERSSSHKI